MANKYTDAVFNTSFPDGSYTKNGKTCRITGAVLKAVGNAIAHRANDDGTCYPGYGRISKDTQLGRTAVIRAVAWLEGIGLFTKGVGASKRGTNEYTMRAVVEPEDDPKYFDGWLSETISAPSVLVVQENPPSVPDALPQCSERTTLVVQEHPNASLNASGNTPEKTSPEVRKKASEGSSSARPTPPSAMASSSEPEQEELDPRVEKLLREAAEMFASEVSTNSETWTKLIPVSYQIMRTLLEKGVCPSRGCYIYASELYRWNKTHKPGKLCFGTDLNQMLTAVRSDSGHSLYQQWLDCTTPAGRKKCKYCKSVSDANDSFSVPDIPPPVPEPPSREEAETRWNLVVKARKCGKHVRKPEFIVLGEGDKIAIRVAEPEATAIMGSMDGAMARLMNPYTWDAFRKVTSYLVPDGFMAQEAVA